MTDPENVLALLHRMRIPVIGSVVENTIFPGNLFVHVAVTYGPNNKRIPSGRRLNEARHALRKQGITIEFIVTDSQIQDIEAGLRATVLHAFGEDIRSVFMSVTGVKADVWLEPKRKLNESVRDTVREKLATYLNEFNIELRSLAMTTDENLPSNLAILRAARHLAPVDINDLMSELLSREFIVPSLDWLRRRLDALRRKGQILWLEGDQYALTLASIRGLGTTKMRGSPDIARLLVLARRGR